MIKLNDIRWGNGSSIKIKEGYIEYILIDGYKFSPVTKSKGYTLDEIKDAWDNSPNKSPSTCRLAQEVFKELINE